MMNSIQRYLDVDGLNVTGSSENDDLLFLIIITLSKEEFMTNKSKNSMLNKSL